MFGGWFHLDCLGLEEDDVPDGNWWCSLECKNYQHGKKKRATVADNLTDNKKCYAMFVINYCQLLVELLAQDSSTHLRGIEQLIQKVDLEKIWKLIYR